MSVRSRSRSAIENVDVAAATIVVGDDLQVADFTSLSEALLNLPTEGGKIVVLSHLDVPSTITFPDKDFAIEWAFGATVTFSGTGPLFKFPNGLTTYRRPKLINLICTGNNVNTESLLELNDVSSLWKPEIYGAQLNGWRIVLDIKAGDLTFTEPVEVRFSHCAVFSPDPSSPFLKSPNVAGTFQFGMVVWFDQCMLSRENASAPPVLDFGWTINFDGDMILSGTPHLTIAATSAVDGFDTADPVEVELHGNNTVFEFKGSNYWAKMTGQIAGGPSGGATGTSFKISGPWAKYYFRAFNVKVTLNNTNIFVEYNTLFTAPPLAVDILAGADQCVVTGIFGDCSTAAIQTAAAKGLLSGSFASTGAHPTVVETGAADNNAISGTGLSTGGGVTTVGASTTVQDAKSASVDGTSTNALVTVVPQITNPKYLQGAGTVQNTGGSNSIDVKESFTDAFGTTSSTTTTVAPGNTLNLTLGANKGTGFPPYVTYKVEIIDTVGGSHSTYKVRFTSQGAT